MNAILLILKKYEYKVKKYDDNLFNIFYNSWIIF